MTTRGTTTPTGRLMVNEHAFDRLDEQTADAQRARPALHRALLQWMPYLHTELVGAVDEREERTLIEPGEIRATGFRYVGERMA
jgi:hypothetical protein